MDSEDWLTIAAIVVCVGLAAASVVVAVWFAPWMFLASLMAVGSVVAFAVVVR
jgi:hypothetical protein